MPTQSLTVNPRLAEQIITHGACRRSWTGAGRCHCARAGCHRTFNSLTAFDAHQVDGRCTRGPLVCKQGLLGEVIWMTGFKGSPVFGVDWLPARFDELVGSGAYRELNDAAREAFTSAMDGVWERDGLGFAVPSQRGVGGDA